MPGPTDRGYAVLSTAEDETTTVLVCTGIEHGKPVNVFAMHVGASRVRVDAGVRLVRGRSGRYTESVVEVVAGTDGAVHVRTPGRARRSLVA
jgi:hypothetical protein